MAEESMVEELLNNLDNYPSDDSDESHNDHDDSGVQLDVTIEPADKPSRVFKK